jgi:hypothetical protein
MERVQKAEMLSWWKQADRKWLKRIGDIYGQVNIARPVYCTSWPQLVDA